MAESKLIIQIDAEIKQFQNQLKKVQDETKNLEKGLTTIAKTSGIAFAGLSGMIGVTIAAYKGQEQATNILTQSLRTQGIYSKELVQDYRDIADALQMKTGFDDDDIVRAQAKLQSYLGQTKVTKELTESLLDYAVAMNVDVSQAAIQLGKAINGDVENLRAMKLNLSENATQGERLSSVIQQLNGRFGGQAQAAAQGLGQLKVLQMVISDLAEEIGKKLAPAITLITSSLISFTGVLKGNEGLTSFMAWALGAGAVLSGLALTVGVAGLSFLKMREAILGVQLAAAALGITIKGALIATGIGALVVLLGTLAYNWEATFTFATSIFNAFANNIVAVGNGIKDILIGIFTLDKSRIIAGMEEVRASFNAGYDQFVAEYNSKRAAQNANDIATDQQHNANKKMIRDLFYEQHMADLAQQDAEMKALKEAMDSATLSEQQIKDLAAYEYEKEKYAKSNQLQLESHKKFLENQTKFGTAYATLYQAMHTAEFQAGASAVNDLVALQNSKNSTLKAIGKAAAVAQIAIQTAQSAMNVFAGFSTIPIVGYGLGMALAAAVIAYGAERTRAVLAAQEGGIVPGTGTGDKVPMMLEPGELVVPRQIAPNFADVMANSGGMGGGANIVLELKGELMDFIEAKLVERNNLSISIQGA